MTTASYDFAGKVVIVTGGGTGIGEGIAAAFHETGASVIVTGRRAEPLEKFCSTRPDRASFVRMDVGIAADRRRTIEEAVARHGRIDVLVNNALSYHGGPFEDQPFDDIEEMYRILLIAPTALIQDVLPHLLESGGSVINISSTAGKYIPFPAWFMAVYSAAKAGLSHLTRTLASELGPKGVRINAIAPGLTRSENNSPDGDVENMYADITPLKRMGEPDDIAAVALFLASDSARWVTGQVVDASGGWGLGG